MFSLNWREFFAIILLILISLHHHNPHLLQKMDKEHLRGLILYHFQCGDTATEAFRKLNTAYPRVIQPIPPYK